MKKSILTMICALFISVATIQAQDKNEREKAKDLEISKILEGKDVYTTTTFNMYGSLVKINSPKIGGVTVTITDDSLLLMVVGKEEYGGVFSKWLRYKKMDKYYFDQKSFTYTMVRDDQSILLFSAADNGYAELLSKDKSAIEKATSDELIKIASKERQSMKAIKRRAESEDFYKKGNVVASAKNPNLQAEFMKILKKENDMPFVTKEEKVAYKEVRLISTNWSVVKNNELP